MSQLVRHLTACALVLSPVATIRGQVLEDVIFEDTSGDAGDQLGSSVALSDVDGDGIADIAVVGAPADDTSAGIDAGAVRVWTKDDGVWSSTPLVIEASDADAGDMFGSSVDAQGLRVVVGARAEDTGAQDAGAVYVYDLTPPVAPSTAYTWTETEKLVFAPGTAQVDAQLGNYVAIDGATVVASARLYDVGVAMDAGRIFVFEQLSGAIWTQVGLDAPDGMADDHLGQHAVDIDGDTIVAGAVFADSTSGADTGAAYVFDRVGGAWAYSQKLEAPSGLLDDFFGLAVAVDSGRIAVGAEGTGAPSVGAVHLYEFDGDWIFTDTLTPSDSSTRGFGSGVDLDGDVLVVGADGSGGSGHVYRWSGKAWLEEATLGSSNPQASNLGHDVSVLSRDALLGAWGSVDSSGDASGQASLYEDVTPWASSGDGLAGTGGVTPVLAAVGELVDGSPVSLELCDVTSAEVFPANLVIGFSKVNLPFRGGVLGPSVDVLITGLPAPGGSLLLANTWPSGVPSDFEVCFQFWITDPNGVSGFASTRTVCGTAP